MPEQGYIDSEGRWHSGERPARPLAWGDIPPPQPQKGKGLSPADRWRAEQDILEGRYGLGGLFGDIMKAWGARERAIEPWMGDYRAALARFQGALPAYREEMGGLGRQFERRAGEALGAYSAAARGAAGQAYGANVAGLAGMGNTINQELAARLARAGMGRSGMGMAAGALGRAAPAAAMPGVRSEYAGQMAGIAGQEADWRRAIAERLFGVGTGVAETGLGFAGQELGANRDLLETLLGQYQGAQDLATQNLYARMGMAPEMWEMLNKERIFKASQPKWWERLLGAGVGLGSAWLGGR